MGKKDKLAVYLTPEKKVELERRYHEDGSKTMTTRSTLSARLRRRYSSSSSVQSARILMHISSSTVSLNISAEGVSHGADFAPTTSRINTGRQR